MTVRLFVHVEEPSMQADLEILLPPLLRDHPVDWRIIDHGSKTALLKNLPARLRAYPRWHAAELRILVLLDRDNQDCMPLKTQLEAAAAGAGLTTKTSPNPADGTFKVVNRIVVEELEAWFLGDVEALMEAYPGVPPSLATKAAFRDPDAVTGGTWEALLRVLHRAGHYAGSDRLPKIEVARRVAARMQAGRNRSGSFQAFVTGLDALMAV